ncbi:PQQ-dependent sugar dehydrogenase [Leisingera sp. MMG026]|uniref:PQQ-dependent sugar dehydrogenase n=1 Tax=Leisingera sp. MMG026 TaxID=2909982 RepID=UPI0031CC3FA4|nr:PQQ-dependent sugar dehydrogenase [Leisingera sp. MMG026]
MSYVLETNAQGIDIQDISLSGDFTIEFNIFFDPLELVSKADGAVSSGNAANGQDINFHQGLPRLFDSAEGDVVTGAEKLNAGEWNHVAFVRENDFVRLYLNGVNDATSFHEYTATFTIEEFASSVAGALDGRMDELRIWSTARSSEEIQEFAARTIDMTGGGPAGLERYYRFDDDPDHIVDATGNAETGHTLHPPAGTAIVNDDTVFDVNIGDAGNLIDTQVVSGLQLPTGMAFLPDGRLLVAQKDGIVRIIEDPTTANSASAVYMDLSSQVLNDREAGLLNIKVDPEFETNGNIYLFYSNEQEQRTTVSRFTHQENTGGAASRADPASEQVLWREHDTYSGEDHQGGGLAIAYEPTGPGDPSPYKMYITIGEEFHAENAQDLTHDDGKVHRINLTDGSVPTDNPYYDAAAAASYTPSVNTLSAISTSPENLAIDPEGVITTIYSHGLRNPFRAEYDQPSNTLWIGEVGGNFRGASEDIHIAAPGADHGWPDFEGYLPDPDDPGSPIFSYFHASGPGQDQLPQFGDAGASVSGGIVYRGSLLPDEYQGAYFYGDWVRNWIRYLEVDYSSGEPVVVSDNHFKNATGQVLTFAEGPDGALYYITTFSTGTLFTFEGAVNRIEFSADNQAPGGTGILLDPGEESNLTAPHTVTFDTDAFDPDGDALTYTWSFGDGIDFDGDGVGDTATSTERAPTYTYTSEGSYVVELVVTDEHGAQTVYNAQTITVGEAPTVTIDTPDAATSFRAGDTITLTGSAFDTQDGALSGPDVYWSMVLNHNEHSHPEFAGIENVPGGISFDIPDTGHDYFGDVGFEIFLTAIDSDGLSTTESVQIRPEESITTFDNPDIAGFTFTIDSVAFQGDLVYDNIVGFRHTIGVQQSYQDAGFQWDFSHWEDDPSITTATREFIVPETDTVLRPVYSQGAPIGPVDAVEDNLAADTADLAGGGWITLPVNALANDTNPSGNPFDVVSLDGYKTNGQPKTTSNFDGSGRLKVWGDNGGQFRVSQDGTIEFRDRDGVFADLAAGSSIITSIGYSISDGDDLDTAPISLNISVGGTPNTAPQGPGILLDPGEDMAAAAPHLVTFASDVTDAEGHTLSYAWDFGDGNSGTGAAPSHTYNADGLYDVTLTVTDELGAATLFSGTSIDVGNTPPLAVDDSVVLPVGFDPVASHLHILDNDSDPDGSLNMQMVEILSGPSHGTIEIMDTEAELLARGLPAGHYGHAEYTPTDPDFEGTDSFTYRVQDNEGAWSNAATVTIEVTDTPTPPLDAVDDAPATALDDLAGGNWITLGTNAFNNDISQGGAPFDLVQLDGYKSNGQQTTTANQDSTGRIKIWGDNGGQFRVAQDGTIEFRDRDGVFTGLTAGSSIITAIAYTIDDGTNSDMASISLSISADGTPNTAPQGPGILLDPGEDMAAAAPHLVTFASDVTDAEGHTLSYAWDFGDGNSGTGAAPSHTYNADGLYDVTLTVTDELGAATLFSGTSIDVGNTPPLAVDDSVVLPVGFDPVASHLHILDNDSDPDGSLNMQMVEILSGPSHGTIEIMDTEAELLARGLPAGHYGHAEYTPTDPDFEGTDSFTYRVQDNEGAWSNAATVTIEVTDTPTPPAQNGVLVSGPNLTGLDIADFTLSGDFTIEFMASFDAGRPINKDDAIFGAGIFQGAGSNDLNFHGGNMRLYAFEDGGDQAVSTFQAPADGSWHHYALVRESGVLNVYVDGVLDTADSFVFNSDVMVERLASGVHANESLDGALDEVRFWDIARSQAEIDAGRGGVVDPASAGLLRYYRFDDPDFIFEETGAGEAHGTLAWNTTDVEYQLQSDLFV